MAWFPVAHAVHTQEFGPFIPNRMEICPDPRFVMMEG